MCRLFLHFCFMGLLHCFCLVLFLLLIMKMKNNLASSFPPVELSAVCHCPLIYVRVFNFVTLLFFFASSLCVFFICSALFHSCWCCALMWMCILLVALLFGCDFIFPHSLPLLGYIKPSGEPTVPRSPQLSALSLHSSSCFSPAFPWCRPNPLAANWKPECHRYLSERQLRHRGWGCRLRQPVPHSAVLSIHRVALQQIGPRPPS